MDIFFTFLKKEGLWIQTTRVLLCGGLALVTGLLLGTGLGLLMAPQAGRRTRRQIRNYLHDTTDRMNDFADETKERMSEFMDKSQAFRRRPNLSKRHLLSDHSESRHFYKATALQVLSILAPTALAVLPSTLHFTKDWKS